MINCNPETVSTDYDTSDRLYFEPLTQEDVLAIIERENPLGVILQFGGQTPLKLATGLATAGVPVLGTQPEGIDLAEDRGRFGDLVGALGLTVPEWGMAGSEAEAFAVAERIGYPVLVRPSYVLGGRAMAIVYSEEELKEYLRTSTELVEGNRILIDRFLEDAFEVDVDALSDGKSTVIAGILQHIEEAGIHSGDSSMVLPSWKIAPRFLDEIRAVTPKLALALGVVGLLNIQFAIRDNVLYILEVNPRASRTVPFISKAIGVSLPRLATRLMLGESLADVGFTTEPKPVGVSVKASIFPFKSFHGVDPVLGPQMRSTGEVMGRDASFGPAFAKAMIGAGMKLPTGGSVFISVNDNDKIEVIPIARRYAQLGFEIYATGGTADALERGGLKPKYLHKIHEGRPNVLDVIKNGEMRLIINTPLGRRSFHDDSFIRIEALAREIPCLTTLSAAAAAASGIEAIQKGSFTVAPLAS
jgi:carbamoyl-phosphate synthase large subunit